MEFRSSADWSRIRGWLGLALIAVGMLALAAMPELRLHIGRYLALYALSVVGYVLVWTATSRLSLRAVLIVALVVRVAFVPVVPSLSDDIYRYVWDGRVQLAGINPYLHAPDSAALDGVDYAERERINHPAIRTIYPPLAEGLFAAVAAAGGGMFTFKVIFGICDLLTALVLWRTVARARRAEVMALYLLCPLVIIETWHAAHLEVVATLLVVISLALIERRRDLPAGLALGAAAAVKLMPAFLLVPALFGGRVSARRFLPGFALAFGLPYIPYVLTGAALGSARDSGARPEGNSLVFTTLRGIVGYETARVAVVVVFIVGAAAISLRVRGRERTAEAFAWTLTLLLLVLPIVHPWYWLTPVALSVAAGIRLPIYLGLAAPAADMGFARWRTDAPRVRWITYAPLAFFGVESAVRARDRRRKAADAPAQPNGKPGAAGLDSSSGS